MKENRRILFTEIGAGCVDNNNRLWYSALGFNSLFCYDIERKKLEWKGVFPGEYIWGSFLFRNCFFSGDKIVFAPYQANAIHIFNIISGEFSLVPIERLKGYARKFYCICVHNNEVFLFGENVPYIAIINMHTGSITYLSDLHEEIQSKKQNGNSHFFARKMLMGEKGMCYLISAKNNVLVNYNLENREYELKDLGEGEGIYNNFYLFKDIFYLIPGKGRCFTTFDLTSNILENHSRAVVDNCMYYETVYKDGELIILPDRGDEYALWSLISRQVEQKPIDTMGGYYQDIRWNCHDISKFMSSGENSNYSYFFCRMNRHLYVIDKKKTAISHEPLFIDSITREKMRDDMCMINKEIIMDSSLYGLADYIRNII